MAAKPRRTAAYTSDADVGPVREWEVTTARAVPASSSHQHSRHITPEIHSRQKEK